MANVSEIYYSTDWFLNNDVVVQPCFKAKVPVFVLCVCSKLPHSKAYVIASPWLHHAASPISVYMTDSLVKCLRFIGSYLYFSFTHKWLMLMSLFMFSAGKTSAKRKSLGIFQLIYELIDFRRTSHTIVCVSFHYCISVVDMNSVTSRTIENII